MMTKAQVAFELDVVQGEKELGVVVVEDLVRRSVHAAEDFDEGRWGVDHRKVRGGIQCCSCKFLCLD